MPMIDPRDFGKIEAQVHLMQRQIDEIAIDLKAVRVMLDNAHGGWRVMVAVAGFTSAATAIVVKLLPFWPFK